MTQNNNNLDMSIFKNEWFYCTLCETVAIHFRCCGNSSCNGGGCSVCVPYFPTIDKMFADGTIPQISEVPHTKEQLIAFFDERYDEENRQKGMNEEEIKAEREKRKKMGEEWEEMEKSQKRTPNEKRPSEI